YLALGDALNHRGAGHDADEEYQRAHDAAKGYPREQARAAIRLARRWSDPYRIDERLNKMLRDCIAVLQGAAEPLDDQLRIQLMAHLARKTTLAVPLSELPPPGTESEGLILARAALSRLGKTSDLPVRVQCEVINECRYAVYDYEPPSETVKLSQSLLQLSEAERSPYYISEALVARAIDRLRLGDVNAARSDVRKHRDTASRSNRAGWLQLTLDSVFDLWDGDFDRAQQRLLDDGPAERAVRQASNERARSADTLQQTWQGQVYWLMRE